MSQGSPPSIPSALASSRGAAGRDFDELEVVYILVARPDRGIARGQHGTIIHVFDDDAYLVEFVNEDGSTRAEADFAAGELSRVPPSGSRAFA